jgi:peptidoglycan-associated lipoprotein
MYRELVRSVRPAAALLIIGTAGCSYVGREDFDTTVTDLRTEMSAQDARISENSEEVDGLRTDMEALETDLAALRDEFEVTVQKLEYGIRFATPVHFEYDSYDLRAEDTELLERFADVVTRFYPDAVVTVEGFADPSGSEAYNLHLSTKRAEAVAAYLTGDAGLNAQTVNPVGYGETRQVRPGERGPGQEGWENRRVAFVVEYTS